MKNTKGCVFKQYLIRGVAITTFYDLPILAPTNEIVEKAIPFNKIRTTKDYDQWVHFFIDDHMFERLWNSPKTYLPLLKKFNGIISPDFSVSHIMLVFMQQWHTYKNRSLGYWLQNSGVKVIPNVTFSDEKSYCYSFIGIRKYSTVAINSNGRLRNKNDRKLFKNGLKVML